MQIILQEARFHLHRMIGEAMIDGQRLEGDRIAAIGGEACYRIAAADRQHRVAQADVVQRLGDVDVERVVAQRKFLAIVDLWIARHTGGGQRCLN